MAKSGYLYKRLLRKSQERRLQENEDKLKALLRKQALNTTPTPAFEPKRFDELKKRYGKQRSEGREGRRISKRENARNAGNELRGIGYTGTGFRFSRHFKHFNKRLTENKRGPRHDSPLTKTQ